MTIVCSTHCIFPAFPKRLATFVALGAGLIGTLAQGGYAAVVTRGTTALLEMGDGILPTHR